MKPMPHSASNRVRVKMAVRHPGIPEVIYPDHGVCLKLAAQVIRPDCNGVAVNARYLPFGGNLHSLHAVASRAVRIWKEVKACPW